MAALRGVKRAVEIGPGRLGQCAKRVAGRRIDYVDAVARARADVFAVDYQGQIGIGG